MRTQTTTDHADAIPQLLLHNGRLVDLNVVREMTGDDDAFIQQLVTMFLATTDEAMSTILQAFKNGDLTGVRNAVHRFKSSCGILGNRLLLNFIANAEHIAYEGNPEGNLEAQLQLLQDIVGHVTEELHQEMHKLQAA